MGNSPTIDFSKYEQPSAPTSGGGIDFSKYASGASDTAGADTVNAQWNELKDKYSLPHNVDLSKTLIENYGSVPKEDFNKIDVGKFSQAYREAHPEQEAPTSFFGRSWDEVKNLVRGAVQQPESTAGFTTPNPQAAVEAVKQRGQEFAQHPAAATGATAVDLAALAAPFFPEMAGKVWSRVSPATEVTRALTSKLPLAEADLPRAGGQIQPALNNTPREVLQHAHDEGIQLTPGQATEDALAQNFQKTGVNAALGGRDLANAIAENRTKFGQAVNGFMDDVDPKRMGLSQENAGQSIKQSAQTAKSVAHDNATQGYEKINYMMDKPIDGTPIAAAWNHLKGNLPVGAEEQILAQTPRSMRGVVEDLLSNPREGYKPTVAQTIQLRSFFREMGETEGLPNQVQGIFRQMSQAADATAEAGTAQYGGTADWRAANAGWKDYATKYGDPQSILYKVNRTQDPNRIVTMLQNAPATDIATLKQEGMTAALDPLKRQVVQDIAKSRFNIAHDGLGGYSDSYLKALFSPEEVKELYLKGDLANRLKYDPNPSGTAAGIQSLEQLKIGSQAKMAAAARLSMPRDALSFLPDKAAASAVRTTPFAPAIATQATLASLGGQQRTGTE